MVACDVFILVYLIGEDADDKLRLPNRAQTANDRETWQNAMYAGRLTTFFGLSRRQITAIAPENCQAQALLSGEYLPTLLLQKALA